MSTIVRVSSIEGVCCCIVNCLGLRAVSTIVRVSSIEGVCCCIVNMFGTESSVHYSECPLREGLDCNAVQVLLFLIIMTYSVRTE